MDILLICSDDLVSGMFITHLFVVGWGGGV